MKLTRNLEIFNLILGFSHVQVSSIKVRNSKPVRLVLEAANEQEEKKRRAIAFREATEEEKKALQIVSLNRPNSFSRIKIYRL